MTLSGFHIQKFTILNQYKLWFSKICLLALSNFYVRKWVAQSWERVYSQNIRRHRKERWTSRFDLKVVQAFSCIWLESCARIFLYLAWKLCKNFLIFYLEFKNRLFNWVNVTIRRDYCPRQSLTSNTLSWTSFYNYLAQISMKEGKNNPSGNTAGSTVHY